MLVFLLLSIPLNFFRFFFFVLFSYNTTDSAKTAGMWNAAIKETSYYQVHDLKKAALKKPLNRYIALFSVFSDLILIVSTLFCWMLFTSQFMGSRFLWIFFWHSFIFINNLCAWTLFLSVLNNIVFVVVFFFFQILFRNYFRSSSQEKSSCKLQRES